MRNRSARRIFVGDIQGCLEPLDALLQAVQLTSRDQFYCVGDLVNRGPDSLGVLRRLRDIGAKSVLGNHDFHLLRIAARTTEVDAEHRLNTVVNAPDATPVLDWLKAQPVIRVEDDIVVVHGGLHPNWTDLPAIAREANAAAASFVVGKFNPVVDFAIHVRNCDPDGRRPREDESPPVPPFAPWDDFYRGDRTVVFGHWARRGLVMRERIRGLDTGCLYGGPLTAWIAEEDRLIQV